MVTSSDTYMGCPILWKSQLEAEIVQEVSTPGHSLQSYSPHGIVQGDEGAWIPDWFIQSCLTLLRVQGQ